MATPLTKRVRRSVQIGHEEWTIALLPPDEVHRFARIEFRRKRAKIGYWLPMESARNDAARRWNDALAKERKRLRKERRLLREKGLL